MTLSAWPGISQTANSVWQAKLADMVTIYLQLSSASKTSKNSLAIGSMTHHVISESNPFSEAVPAFSKSVQQEAKLLLMGLTCGYHMLATDHH